MKFEATIFDLDGTIVDAAPAWRKAYKTTFAHMNHELTQEEFVMLYRMTGQETINYFYNVFNRNVDHIQFCFADIMKIYNEQILAAYAKNIHGKPFAKEFILSLYRKGIPVCVATLTPQYLAKLVLERLGLMPAIQFIITGDDVGYSKQHPHIYLKAIDKMGAMASKTMVFEDSLTAAKTAKKAGFMVCGVYDKYQHYSFNQMKNYSDVVIFDYEKGMEEMEVKVMA